MPDSSTVADTTSVPGTDGSVAASTAPVSQTAKRKAPAAVNSTGYALADSVISGPYNVGMLFASNNFNLVSSNLVMGSLINITISGWALNVFSGRQPLELFGLAVSAAGQAGFGAVMGMSPASNQKTASSA